jgi:hypothetical protein
MFVGVKCAPHNDLVAIITREMGAVNNYQKYLIYSTTSNQTLTQCATLFLEVIPSRVAASPGVFSPSSATPSVHAKFVGSCTADTGRPQYNCGRTGFA